MMLQEFGLLKALGSGLVCHESQVIGLLLCTPEKPQGDQNSRLQKLKEKSYLGFFIHRTKLEGKYRKSANLTTEMCRNETKILVSLL